ncbi:MAG TPA: TonB family protein, partial [Terriglobales bacterium]|nr:TonB family protein [Terriglobales bacterium]
ETVPAPPVAALKSRITLPTMTVTPVAPAPDTSHLKQSRPVLDQSATAVEPAPVVRDVRNKPSDLSLATKVDAVAPAPKLELPLQRAALNEKGQDVVAPPPATQNLPAGPNPSGQLLALSVRPKAPSGELRVPDGSRSGVFAATPTGKPGAPGTPELVTNDSGVETGGSGKADTKQGSGSGNSSGLAVPGISVTGGDTRHGTSAVVAKVPQTQPEAPRTIASAAKPLANSPFASPSAIDRQPVAPYTPPSERKVEDEVFGKRKYYSMQLNMPNLTSAGGSWIIRFAELRETPESSTSELSTPVVTTKVDPAYPPDLMQERVEGFVTLYAVINANGSVGEVRLLRGLNDRLDENAIKALGRWHFRPATRNGVAVALEAVVQIPFKARRFSSF